MNAALSFTALYERLREDFGLGDYDEERDGEYHQWRIREVAKLKAMCSKRNVPPERLALTAEYCRQSGIVVKKPWELFDHITKALIQLRKDERAQRNAAAVNELQRASADALERGELAWFERFLRMKPGSPEADQVLTEWMEYKP